MREEEFGGGVGRAKKSGGIGRSRKSVD
jgi:hypothetical protein